MYNGVRPLDPPSWWLRLFDGNVEEEGEDTVANQDVQMPHRDLAGAPEVR